MDEKEISLCYNSLMNKLLLIIFFTISLSAYQLLENYTFKNSTIYSNDLFPDITKKFEILKIPEEKSLYRINAQVVAKTFELNGIEIDVSKTRYVNFTKESSIDFTTLKHQLEILLRGQYPTITIEEISILPRGYLASLNPKSRGVFDENFFQNSKGTFYVIDDHGIRRYFDYTVRATLSVLHTNQKISRRERLSGFNTRIKSIPFTSFKDIPLTTLPDHPSRFRANIKPDQPLTQRHIEPLPLVLKNSKIIAQVQNDTVIVEFGATAVQEGALYDIITILKMDGKRAKAKVIGENRVELQ
jgi:flagella basal body P-ring formation protein FlgA